MPQQIGVFLFDDFEELDAVGPYEVLGAWSQHWPDDGWEVSTFSASGGPVRAAKGLVVHPQCSAKDAPPLDVLVYPGGRGTRQLAKDEMHLEWVRAQRAAVPLLTSVCTGALVLAAAGLLAGRPATTHWAATDELRAIDPTVEVREGVRYVDDGDVITAAGVSAGIDMALHLVARLVGEERARNVRRAIQYDPEPPF
jgi:transcriptional regulator GlxA family with amidase domain